MTIRGWARAYRDEPVVTRRVLKSTWFPHRTAQWRGITSDTWGNTEINLGPWKWNPPRRGPLRWLWFAFGGKDRP